jgi:hypothetical protein
MIDLIERGVLRLSCILADRPLPPPTDLDRARVDAMRAEYSALPVLDTQNVPPSLASWNRNLNELRDRVLHDDPRSFLRWPMVQRTMFVTYPRWLLPELFHLRALPDWSSRWREVLRESPEGHPLRFGLYPSTSGNLAHHAYHLARFEALSGQRVEEADLIVEFGGGYGSLCRLVRRLGFRGRYIIFDLPHFSALQRHYLAWLGVPVAPPGVKAAPADGVACVSDLDDLDEALRAAGKASKRMFIATFSLSETPVELREQVLPRFRDFERFLVAFQHRFEEADNVAFFDRWSRSLEAEVAWRRERIEHLGDADYLVGRRRT